MADGMIHAVSADVNARAPEIRATFERARQTFLACVLATLLDPAISADERAEQIEGTISALRQIGEMA